MGCLSRGYGSSKANQIRICQIRILMKPSKIIQDPEYQRLVVPDGKVFSKTEESKIMIGYDKEFIAHGTTAMG